MVGNVDRSIGRESRILLEADLVGRPDLGAKMACSGLADVIEGEGGGRLAIAEPARERMGRALMMDELVETEWLRDGDRFLRLVVFVLKEDDVEAVLVECGMRCEGEKRPSY